LPLSIDALSEDDAMRIPISFLAVIVMLKITGVAEARDPYQPGGGGYVDTKHPKVTKDFYVVRGSHGDQCTIVPGDFGNPPAGAIGSAPYASEDYAKAALKKFPECKGGEGGEGGEGGGGGKDRPR
jgi:hypothetical protein